MTQQDRPIRYYVVRINGTVAIWQMPDIDFVALRNQRPGMELIASYTTREEAEVVRSRELQQ